MARLATVSLSILFALLLTFGAIGWVRPMHHHDDHAAPHASHGCIHKCAPRFDQKFHDADRRLAGNGHDTRQGLHFEIPAGSEVLRIGASYDLDGEATFTLRDPVGRSTTERIDGDNTLSIDAWKTIDRPLPGTWTFSAELDATGEYVFGFYY